MLYVRCCSAMLLGLCPKVLSPRSTNILSGFWQAMSCWIHLGVKCKDRSNILGPDEGQVWPSWALLRYLEATALLLATKLGDLEGKLGYREVMLKVEAKLGYVMSRWSYIMSDFVLPCCWFCIPKCSAILWLWWHCWHMLAPFWDQVRPSRGPWWCYVGSVRGIQLRHRQNPMALEA